MAPGAPSSPGAPEAPVAVEQRGANVSFHTKLSSTAQSTRHSATSRQPRRSGLTRWASMADTRRARRPRISLRAGWARLTLPTLRPAHTLERLQCFILLRQPLVALRHEAQALLYRCEVVSACCLRAAQDAGGGGADPGLSLRHLRWWRRHAAAARATSAQAPCGAPAPAAQGLAPSARTETPRS